MAEQERLTLAEAARTGRCEVCASPGIVPVVGRHLDMVMPPRRGLLCEDCIAHAPRGRVLVLRLAGGIPADWLENA